MLCNVAAPGQCKCGDCYLWLRGTRWGGSQYSQYKRVATPSKTDHLIVLLILSPCPAVLTPLTSHTHADIKHPQPGTRDQRPTSVGVLSPPPPRPAPGPDTPPQTDGAPVSIGHADQRSPDLRGCAGAGKTRTMLPGVATCSHPRHTSRPGHCHQAATNINTEWISIFCTWILIDDLHNSFRKTQNCSTRY